MLQLNNICKSYTTGSFTQKALDDVSISFRDNEFVSILGPSGSGKTTLLNIIGGLDHYDSGDLIIEGISTKQFKDRDWDAYRNNRIGFVFQSYNLIPHQTVLANVELALTLSGVSRGERRNRAIQALNRVGLGDHIDKKPAQMSGGQMQRVAIARALINDPEILLADEPTGALDSKTSVQIMDLLTEIASDRLVVMVTHNPELAEQYSTRIVNLADGRIMSDTDPYLPTPAEIAAANAKPTRRTAMSFLTALSLSANNLLTKKGRTIMTAIAGSIGIIGIAAIMSLANGVNNYIKNVEEDTLSVYPLQILSSGFDMTSMFVGMAGGGSDDDSDGASATAADSSESASQGLDPYVDDGRLHEVRMMTRMFASFGNNDLQALKAYLDSGESGIESYVNDIFYEYAVTPQIFDPNTSNGVRQINPDRSFESLGFSSTATNNSLMSLSMSTDMFAEMPSNNEIIVEQFDVVRGRWPEKHNELVLILSQSGRISDFMSYVLGLRDPEELKEMIRQFSEEEEVDAPDSAIDVSYDDLMGMKFKLVNATSFYKRNDENNVWVDKSDDKAYMKEVVDAGEDLQIVGIMRPREGAKAVALTQGIYYTPALIEHIANTAAASQIVKDQLADPKRDVFSGRTFEELENEEKESFDMSSLFTIDNEALAAAFKFDTSAFDSLGSGMQGLDLSNMDLSGLDLSNMQMPGLDLAFSGADISPSTIVDLLAAQFPTLDRETISGILSDLNVNFTDRGATLVAAMQAIIQGYPTWVGAHPGEDISAYVQSPEVQKQLAAAAAATDLQDIRQQLVSALAKALGTEDVNPVQEAVDRVLGVVQQQITGVVTQYLTQVMTQYMTQIAGVLESQITAGITGMMSQLASIMSSAMQVDPDAFMRAFKFNVDPEEFGELMMSMMYVEQHSYDNNLKKLGYADFAKPSEISIYPKDFESKEQVISILDGYNDNMREIDEDKVISYTDIVGTLMQSVTTIVNMISTMLIAFVAISLIVSSIMIGVITYISVLERKKEIGILRSIGASKGNISSVFNAETVIEGLIAGLLGVGFTALACIPANAIVYSVFEVPDIALLPPQGAAALVVISVVLTFIAGLIPSSAASRKDPVEALRSE